MKISQITRLAGLILVAGFFYSCGSTQVNVDELLANEKYQQAITELDSRLAENPSQPNLYIQRAEINARLAQEQDPEVRAEFYENVTTDFTSALEYGATDAQLSKIDSLKQQYWKSEHNAGLRLSESEDITNRYQRAIIHFQNALILLPDAVSSYKNLSVAQFNLGNLDQAINALESALDYAPEDETSVEIYENLGYLHLEKGEPDQAARYYEMANKEVENNLNLAFGLINAYIANGNSESAVELLEGLVEQNPDNASLRNVYGTQLYEITSNIINDLKEAYSANDSSLVDQIMFEAEGMGDEAETQLIEAYRRDTTNTDYLESLAVFYNNLSAQYLSLLPNAFESDRNEIQDKAVTLINFAIDYYEKLVEADPNNSEYNSKLNVLQNLHQRFSKEASS